MDEARLTNIETTIAFQEKTIGDLSDVICRQQDELDLLKKQAKELIERLKDADDLPAGETMQLNEIPPHY